MTETPALDPPVTPADLAPFRPTLVAMVEPIVDQIRAEIPGYLGPTGGKRHHLMSMAATMAIRAYLEAGKERESSLRKVNELFHRMGWGEAQDGSGPENLERALQIATRLAWQHLADRAVAIQASSAVLRQVTTALHTYTDHLRTQLLAGHATGVRHPLLDEDSRRGKLLTFFQNNSAGRISPGRSLGADRDTVARLALAANWDLPDEVCTVGMAFTDGDPRLPDRPDLLQRVDTNRVLIVAPAEEALAVATQLGTLYTHQPVVITWPVPVDETGSSVIWTQRALDLIDLGILPRDPLVRCEDHVSELWLHSEPAMRRRLCQELLEPLLAESPNSREILSETLLTWLETRDSAPAIAARLDVHPQTVRYRWRRINEIFGESLQDPEFVVQLTMVLKASVPLWKAGDQRDFDLFRTTQENDS